MTSVTLPGLPFLIPFHVKYLSIEIKICECILVLQRYFPKNKDYIYLSILFYLNYNLFSQAHSDSGKTSHVEEPLGSVGFTQKSCQFTFVKVGIVKKHHTRVVL